MRDDIRDRLFTPFVLPVTVIGVMLLIGISLSRVLLAVSEYAAAAIALLAAGYIMAIAFFVEARRRIPPRTLGVALAIGLIGLVGAGAVASAAGIREVEHGEEETAGGEGEGGEEAGGANVPLFVAIDIDYSQAPEALPPGDIDFSFENQGAIEHNVVIEELGDELILEAPGGGTDEATVTMEPGEYTYYCSIPGHRATMEGVLSIEEGAEAAEGGDGGGTASEEAETGSAADTTEEPDDGATEDGGPGDDES